MSSKLREMSECHTLKQDPMLLRSTYSAGYRARAEVGDKVSVEDVGGAGVAGQGLAYDLAHQPQLRPLGVLGAALA